MNTSITRPLLSKEEISRRGEELYASSLRSQVETEENIGKLIALDINTGAYEIDAYSLSAADRLRARFPDAVVYVLRIGYDAVYTLGGIGIKYPAKTMPVEDYLALCEEVALLTPDGKFDSAADLRRVREEE